MANQRIIDLLTATGMKRNDIAAVLGVDPSTLRRWSYGETHPPAEKLAELERMAGGETPPRPARQMPQAQELARFSSSALIDELARRARGGILQDPESDASAENRPLRSVAFRDVREE